MFIDLVSAKNWFDRLPARYRYPTLDPEYIYIESKQRKLRQSVFYLKEHAGQFYYLSGYLTKSKEGFIDFETPRGYGGLLSNISNLELLKNYQSECEHAFLSKGVLCGFIRNTPLLNNYNALLVESWFDRYTVSIDLNIPDLLPSYKTRARTAIRKALKSGVLVKRAESDEQWQSFALLYSQRMKELGATDEYLYDNSYFHDISKLIGSKLYLAYLHDELVSGCIILESGSYAEYHLSASTKIGMVYASTQACIHIAATESQKNGVQFMHLGGGLSNSDEDALMFFKSGFSDRKHDFVITGWIFDTSKYADLKRKYVQQGKAVNRIIFYR
ncbi:hypothetical protein NI389_14370 [Pseudoalteromonas xiamenensis]|uniref:hypothetical protein n=1 Tax=Pseudoalteromonas xiamenensis TaxID=882626 RepID=UPI0027E56C9C|nr:hypothetical protein [Pseudoalteromonas xiamenensis]WMN59382.1 hypothetical protein NI389_14370 [Pseudoalteromonas xiamenensis]